MNGKLYGDSTGKQLLYGQVKGAWMNELSIGYTPKNL